MCVALLATSNVSRDVELPSCLPCRCTVAAAVALLLRVWRSQVAHTVRIVSFLALQLPVFTYLITQFQVSGPPSSHRQT